MVSYYPSYAVYNDPDMKSRSNIISFNDSSPNAILNISEVQCKDDGQYQCIVGYMNSHGIEIGTQTETSVYIQVMADIPEFTIQPANTTLEEYSAVNLSCSANVGRPGGKVTIWKQSHISDERIQLGNSSSSVTDTGNCSDYANLLITYNLSRSDHGFIFGCTSKNKHTNDPAPSKEVGPRTILYGPSKISFELRPNKTNYYVTDVIKLTCNSDGNPKPTFRWKFNSTDIMENRKYTFLSENATVQFTIQYLNESGNYQCYVENFVNEKYMNKSEYVALIVVEPSTTPQPIATESCVEDTCSFMETCYTNDDTAVCSLHIWKLISFVFITLSLILGMATLSLCLLLRIRKRRIGYINGGLQMSNNKFEDFGGYADPKDVKRPYTHVVEENEGRDNPYADPLDIKTVYTSVQKSAASPIDSSRPESTTTPQSLLNPQGPENISSNTDSSSPGNDSHSDNIPKPPNVYDDAWV
uniref:Peroxidasin homolog isoform X2 n=1 Tax=Crassostrea virginica TaxID=6565 RepID=A0A8B8EDH2_CRAVI|nr:peroxidasin homolog isoform X2 [Crassostrea virginica]